MELNEQLVAVMATGTALLDGRGLVKKGAYHGLSKTADGTLMFAECQGSGKSIYKVSMDMGGGRDRPVLRCNCPSRQHPCKHAIGLMLLFIEQGSEFQVAEA